MTPLMQADSTRIATALPIAMRAHDRRPHPPRELVVGQSMPSETSLAKSLGVNRSTMREAIDRSRRAVSWQGGPAASASS